MGLANKHENAIFAWNGRKLNTADGRILQLNHSITNLQTAKGMPLNKSHILTVPSRELEARSLLSGVKLKSLIHPYEC